MLSSLVTLASSFFFISDLRGKLSPSRVAMVVLLDSCWCTRIHSSLSLSLHRSLYSDWLTGSCSLPFFSGLSRSALSLDRFTSCVEWEVRFCVFARMYMRHQNRGEAKCPEYRLSSFPPLPFAPHVKRASVLLHERWSSGNGEVVRLGETHLSAWVHTSRSIDAVASSF